MNDMLADWKSIAITLLGALVGILTYLGRNALRRLEEVERQSITKDYVDEKHEQNNGRFDRLEQKIDTGITGTHQRIDKLFERLPERK